jgi:hypothetical protein
MRAAAPENPSHSTIPMVDFAPRAAPVALVEAACELRLAPAKVAVVSSGREFCDERPNAIGRPGPESTLSEDAIVVCAGCPPRPPEPLIGPALSDSSEWERCPHREGHGTGPLNPRGSQPDGPATEVGSIEPYGTETAELRACCLPT